MPITALLEEPWLITRQRWCLPRICTPDTRCVSKVWSVLLEGTITPHAIKHSGVWLQIIVLIHGSQHHTCAGNDHMRNGLITSTVRDLPRCTSRCDSYEATPGWTRPQPNMGFSILITADFHQSAPHAPLHTPNLFRGVAGRACAIESMFRGTVCTAGNTVCWLLPQVPTTGASSPTPAFF